MTTSPIHIVLVKSHYSRNVGSVSRVMANMGAQRLILIAPECEIDLEARQGAAGAQTHLMEHTKYISWPEFFKSENDGLMIAFCARGKKDMDPIALEKRIMSLKIEPEAQNKPLYFIFGPEDHGLENEDLEYANYICTIPVFGSFKSLNLSHAVLLALYITKSIFPETSTQNSELESQKFFFPDKSVKAWLHKLGFAFGERRTDAYKVIKRILLRNLASPKELRILEAVINQTVRKLPGDRSDSE